MTCCLTSFYFFMSDRPDSEFRIFAMEAATFFTSVFLWPCALALTLVALSRREVRTGAERGKKLLLLGLSLLVVAVQVPVLMLFVYPSIRTVLLLAFDP